MKITKRHRKAIELLIDGKLTKEEIAKIVNVSRTTLYNWLADDNFNEELEEQIAEIDRLTRTRIRNMTKKALDRQEKILDHSKNDIAAASVASDVLDRAGFSHEDTVNIRTIEPIQIVNDIPVVHDETE